MKRAKFCRIGYCTQRELRRPVIGDRPTTKMHALMNNGYPASAKPARV